MAKSTNLILQPRENPSKRTRNRPFLLYFPKFCAKCTDFWGIFLCKNLLTKFQKRGIMIGWGFVRSGRAGPQRPFTPPQTLLRIILAKKCVFQTLLHFPENPKVREVVCGNGSLGRGRSRSFLLSSQALVTKNQFQSATQSLRRIFSRKTKKARVLKLQP